MIKNYEKKPHEFAAAVRAKAGSGAVSVKELAGEARKSPDPVTEYAAVYLAVQQGLGLTPFDSQIIAGMYLDGENAVELNTGEGKTIAAVFPAFRAVCEGKHVHILTFNDYLANRDREWMKPVYDLLGVSTACITEKTGGEDRKAAYNADVLYSTVKECGFDFLRDFLVFSPDETVSRGFENTYAIVDEADSLLIDEARIPLIAAGVMDVEKDAELPEIFEFVKTLGEGDYDTDEASSSAFLTRSGEQKAEEHFGLENIYDEENNELLVRINDSLIALHVLEEDKDYIVKDGKISIIDLFTGRSAENRCFPGLLQSAVELKHGLDVTERGAIMGSIPIQFYMRQYERISGMTGTAMSAAEEFDELYGLVVKHVEPNTPSVRVDLPMAVYYDEESKLNAVVSEVKAAHDKKQPVLIGTADIAQSERLSELLTNAGIEHSVLNAKNDELEAGIIKNAGMPGAVTVSTNMAGRGVDIKLGGEDEKLREEAVSAGGLYAIGTFLAESARINDQLRGRAARQGDPGQSRLFVSLDEKIMTIYKLKNLIPRHKYPSQTTEEITDRAVVKEVARIQKISQGKTLDERIRLLKFTTIGEKHRDLVFSTRGKFLRDERVPTIWQENAPELYEKAVGKYGKEAVDRKQLEYMLAMMNSAWINYLGFSTWLRDSIHLSAIGGADPAEEYNIRCEEYYGTMNEEIISEMEEGLEVIAESGIEALKIPKPKRVFTYLLEDTGDELHRRSLSEALNDVLSDEDYEEYYGEDSADESEEATEEAPEDVSAKKEKKGFFAKLFKSKE
ncbi:MAG: preprotein translocase subunit SecA [Ruminiclostridium sp.]|nr:preprotein translocase subunit SecA [Ruminiclostridium sp.]